MSRYLPVVLALCACNELTFTEIDDPPIPLILAPLDGSEHLAGPLRVTGEVSNEDQGELDIIWQLDGVDVCEEVSSGDTVRTECEVVLPLGEHVVRLFARDTFNESASTQITVVGLPEAPDEPPVVNILTPAPGTVATEGALVVFEATAFDDADTDLSVRWSSDVDGDLGLTATDSAGRAAISVATLTPGPHGIAAWVEDSAGGVGSDLVPVVINVPPGPPVVALSPDPAFTMDELRVTLPTPSVDPEGDAVSYTYAWSRDGVPSTASTNDRLPSTATSRGETWAVTVTPGDGYGTGDVGTASVTVQNSPPTLVSVTLDPDPAVTDDRLTCTPDGAADADGDPISFTYAWEVDGVVASTTTNTWRGDFAVDTVIRCSVVPDDGTDAGDRVWSQPVTILAANQPPVVDAVSLTPVEPQTADTLACAAASASDPEGSPLTLATRWWVTGTLLPVSAETLDGSWFDRGDWVQCGITASDGALSSDETRSAVVTVRNTPPVLDAVALTPEDPTVDTVLSCVPGASSDADGDGVSLSYAWTVDGTVVPASDATLDGTWFDAGSVVSCAVTPADGFEEGVAVRSPTVTIVNTPPTVGGVSVTPDTPRPEEVLTCVAVGVEDPDGDTVTYEVVWYVDGVEVGTGETFDTTGYVRGDAVSCVVTPTDGTGDGDPVASDPVALGNALPTVDAVLLSPDPATETSVFTCLPGGVDDTDGDTVSLQWQWWVGGQVVPVTAETLDGTWFDRDELVQCSLTPHDGIEPGLAVLSNEVTVENTPPTLASALVSPDPAAVTDALTCTPGPTDDVDGDSVDTRIVWTVDGTEVGSGPVLTGGFGRGDDVVCTATPTDGTDDGAPVSATVTVGNGVPTAAAPVVTPSEPTASDALHCDVDLDDPDGDVVTADMVWTVDGVEAGTGDTLPAGTPAGSVVVCIATPDDGQDVGDPVASMPVTITNGTPLVADVQLAPTTADETTTLTCTGTGSDADGDPVSLTFAWYVDGALIPPTDPTLTGLWFDRGASVVCGIVPSDGSTTGEEALSQPVVIGNAPPEVADVTLTPPIAVEGTVLTCLPGSTSDPDGDGVTVSYRWWVSGVEVPPTTDTLDGTWFDEGDEVTCEVVPNDGQEDGASVVSEPVTIVNAAPELTAASVSPDPARTGDTLVCTPDGATDADGDPVDFAWSWQVNGSEVPGDQPTLGPQAFERGDLVACVVTPLDGDVAGDPVVSPAVPVLNTPPEPSAVTLTPTEADEDTVLLCAGSATDADGDTVSMSVRWIVDGTTLPETTDFLDGTWFDRGDDVQCGLTATDGFDVAAEGLSNVVTIGNSAPEIGSVSITPTPADTTSVLTCAAAGLADADGDPVVVTLTWTVDGVAVGTGPQLQGAFAEGDTVVCTAVPSDGLVDGLPVASDTLVVGNAPPTVADATITPGDPGVEDTLTCTASGAMDPDGEPVTIEVAWEVDGQAAGTGDTLAGGFVRGDSVVCIVTPVDDDGPGMPVRSAPVTVGNTAPAVDAVLLTPTDPRRDDVLTCTPGSTDDADGDPVSAVFAWWVDGVAQPDTTPTLAAAFERGDVVQCSVTPTDGLDDGAEVFSNAVTVGDTAPTLAGVVIQPDVARTETLLTCVATGGDDVDGDTVTYRYAWTVDGTTVAVTGNTLASSWFERFARVRCAATPTAAGQDGTQLWSDERVIDNTPPEGLDLLVSPSDPGHSDTLVASTVGWDDPDGDPPAWRWSWNVDGATLAVDVPTLPPSAFRAGSTIVVTATPFDPYDDGPPLTATVEIAPQVDCGGGELGLPISRCADLDAIVSTGLDETYCLVEDLDCTAYGPISHDVAFTGILRGRGHTVRGLASAPHGLFSTMSGELTGLELTELAVSPALFGALEDATVQEVALSGVATGSSYVGLLAGTGARSALSDLTAAVDVTATGQWSGGLVGQLEDSTLQQVLVTGTVSGGNHTGGAVGLLQASSVTDLTVDADVDGDARVGGAFGEAIGAVTLTGLDVSGAVVATSDRSGGIAGAITDIQLVDVAADVQLTAIALGGGLVGESTDGTVVDGTVSGLVQGNARIGGAVGLAMRGTLDTVVSDAAVVGTDVAVGGLVGALAAAEVLGCEASGSVSGHTDVGGLVGHGYAAMGIADSRATGTVDANGDAGGLVGRMDDGTLSRSEATGGTVSGNGAGVGGLVGRPRGACHRPRELGRAAGRRRRRGRPRGAVGGRRHRQLQHQHPRQRCDARRSRRPPERPDRAQLGRQHGRHRRHRRCGRRWVRGGHLLGRRRERCADEPRGDRSHHDRDVAADHLRELGLREHLDRARRRPLPVLAVAVGMPERQLARGQHAARPGQRRADAGCAHGGGHAGVRRDGHRPRR